MLPLAYPSIWADLIMINLDPSGIAEIHSQKILDLELSESEKIMESYKRVSRNIRARLKYLPPDKYTAQYLRGVLLQIERAMIDFQKEHSDSVLGSVNAATELGVDHLLTEVVKYNADFEGSVVLRNVNVELLATQYSERLFNQYNASLLAYNADLRGRLALALQDLVIEGLNSEEINERLLNQGGIARFFEGESWRLRRIVRTELHGIYSGAKMGTMRSIKEYEPEIKKTLYHPLDSRTAADSEYVMSLNLRVDVDQPFSYEWRGEQRVFMAPPDRPNDRSILIPYHPSWY